MTKSDQARKRAANRNSILRTLHFSGPMQRSELSRVCDIRKSSVTDIVAELMEMGLLCQESHKKSRSRIMLQDKGWHVPAVSLTRNGVQFARVYLDGRVEDASLQPVQEGMHPSQIIKIIGEGLLTMVESRPHEVLGTGVAVAGIVDHGSGAILHSAGLGGWRGVELGKELAETLKAPVLVENDARCQVWACAWFDRLLKDHDNILYLGIFEGVACAMIMHGLRVYGGSFAAGEIGHVRIGDQGRLCKCGKIDCVEAYCSIPAILEEIGRVDPQTAQSLAGAGDIARAYGGNRAIENILDRITQQLARALAGLVAAIDPQVLVVGTRDRGFSEIIQPLLQRHLYAELVGMGAQGAEIMIADAVDIGTLKGIAGLVIERYFQSV